MIIDGVSAEDAVAAAHVKIKDVYERLGDG